MIPPACASAEASPRRLPHGEAPPLPHGSSWDEVVAGFDAKSFDCQGLREGRYLRRPDSWWRRPSILKGKPQARRGADRRGDPGCRRRQTTYIYEAGAAAEATALQLPKCLPQSGAGVA
eukprot:498485-Prymnesium_polylepis.1